MVIFSLICKHKCFDKCSFFFKQNSFWIVQINGCVIRTKLEDLFIVDEGLATRGSGAVCGSFIPLMRLLKIEYLINVFYLSSFVFKK